MLSGGGSLTKTGTGTLTLSQNGTQLTTITLGSQGVANYQFTSSTLSPGTYTLAAAYSGDSSYKASTTTQKLTITKAPVSAIAGPTNGSPMSKSARLLPFTATASHRRALWLYR